jgi:hypothetical protein
MKVDIKPSQLPANTVIVELGHGMWIKDSEGFWTEVHPRNPEYALTISDKGFIKPKSGYWGLDFPPNPVEKPSDDFFGDFEVLSVPIGYRVPRPKLPETKWWPIPGHPNYVIREDGVKIRNIKHGSRDAKNKAKSGFFMLYSRAEHTAWTLSEIGNDAQIKHFLATGELPK